MKLLKTLGVVFISAALLLGQTSCGMSKTGSGALIGGAGAGALGAGLGALLGGGKGAAIGAGVGAAVGAGVGALIGNRMDKQQKQLEEQLKNQAKIEIVDDPNGIPAIKVTMEGGILFPTNGTSLSANAKTDLTKFAESLKQYNDTDVKIFGFTDNTGSMAANEKVSNGRAKSVLDYLKSQGVAADRLASEGIPMSYYVASNDTEAGRAQNRRVEIYILATEEMIKAAEAGTLK